MQDIDSISRLRAMPPCAAFDEDHHDARLDVEVDRNSCRRRMLRNSRRLRQRPCGYIGIVGQSASLLRWSEITDVAEPIGAGMKGLRLDHILLILAARHEHDRRRARQSEDEAPVACRASSCGQAGAIRGDGIAADRYAWPRRATTAARNRRCGAARSRIRERTLEGVLT